jgi:hypothetical protein
MNILKQATAVDVLIGPFVDKTDKATAEESETPAVLLSKNGQALAAKTDATVPTHDDVGYYNCELDATDTDTVGNLVLVVEATASAAPVRHDFQVIEEAVYDALYGSGATAPASAALIGVAGAGLTAVPWNAAWDDEVQSECADALTAYDPPTNAEMEARTLATAAYATAAKQTDIETDTQNIQTRIPAALVSGRMDSNISAVHDIEVDGAGTGGDPWGPVT